MPVLLDLQKGLVMGESLVKEAIGVDKYPVSVFFPNDLKYFLWWAKMTYNLARDQIVRQDVIEMMRLKVSEGGHTGYYSTVPPYGSQEYAIFGLQGHLFADPIGGKSIFEVELTMDKLDVVNGLGLWQPAIYDSEGTGIKIAESSILSDEV